MRATQRARKKQPRQQRPGALRQDKQRQEELRQEKQRREALRQEKTGRGRRTKKPSAVSARPRAKPAARPPAGPAPGRGTDPARVKEIMRRLDQLYPEAHCALWHSDPWQLLVATILSAQCTDERVNKVTPELFLRYASVYALAALEPEELEPVIRSTGFFRNKAKSIVGAARRVVSDFRGQVPDTMEEILTLPGVARKTANVVLGVAYNKATGIVVDTHVHRIARRLDLTRQDHPVKIEQDLMKIIPLEKWIDFGHQVIWHGRKLCMAQRPRCAECLLDDICYARDKWKPA